MNRVGRNHFLDVAKGMSIILVLVIHCGWTDETRQKLLFPFLVTIAVPVFVMITGYVSAVFFEKNDVDTLRRGYAWAPLRRKICRYTIPFFCMYAVEIGIELLRGSEFTFLRLLKGWLKGGIGKSGTYYYPVLIQLCILLPLIYYVVKKWKYGIVLCFFADLAFEFLRNVTGMEGKLWRLLALRYFFAAAMGCFLYLYSDRIAKWKWIVMWSVGFFYLFLMNYTGYQPVFFVSWKNTSAISVFYIAPLLLLGLGKQDIIRVAFLERIGRASYYIFLVQIVYYNYLFPHVCLACPSRVLQFIINEVVCLAAGYAFYLLYNKIAEKGKELRMKQGGNYDLRRGKELYRTCVKDWDEPGALPDEGALQTPGKSPGQAFVHSYCRNKR